MKLDITVILTLYKTPKKILKKLNQYKKYKLILFDQSSDGKFKKEIRKILNFKFKYYSSSKNIGLSKSSNFLLSKVKTKYCLFTQPDISISNTSISKLRKAINLRKDIIFAGPKFFKKKIKFNKFNKSTNYKITKNLNAACMLCEVKKLKEIGFFDEDFFLYWEDVNLMRIINKTNYKMIYVNNAHVIHNSSQSSENNLTTQFIRDLNFKYGEFLYDYKVNNLRFLKVFRQLFQNIIFFLFNILIFRLEHFIRNIGKVIGILKFIKFYLIKTVTNI